MKQFDRSLIWVFALAKLVIHFLTNTNYGLHRDEFLYLDEGQHLSWGFMEVPPFTPFLAWWADLLGNSIFAVRLFPALAGAIIILLAGYLVKSLGGKTWAIIFCCGALLFSPQLLGSNTLLQPVSFNQLFWFLSAYALFKIIQTEETKYWYLLGIVAGVGFLNKYSIIFYFIALIVALLFGPGHKYFKTKYPYLALGIATLIALPNLIWQWQHQFPVMAHMEALSASQLVNMNWQIFLSDQLQFHYLLSLIWFAGLYGLFRQEQWKAYRPLGMAMILTVLIIGLLSGKSYYTAGGYLILFPFGGLFLTQLLTSHLLRGLVLAVLIGTTLPILPYALPLFKAEPMAAYCKTMSERFGLDGPLRWEDGNYYSLPQDIADMHGWEELAAKVAKLYHSLPKEKQASCSIYGGFYAHAGAVNYYAKEHELPAAHSLSSSYLMWAPSEMDFDNQIMIDDVWQEESSWFNQMVFVDSIQHPLARERGYIYYRQDPKIDVQAAWRDFVQERKQEFNFE